LNEGEDELADDLDLFGVGEDPLGPVLDDELELNVDLDCEPHCGTHIMGTRDPKLSLSPKNLKKFIKKMEKTIT